MKKIVLTMLAIIIALGSFGVVCFAEAPSEITVYVTVSDKDGKLVLAMEPINVTDTDNDGKLTINDALYAAHEEKYEGGAAAGYASSIGSYGISLDKLWGTANGGSYGFYLNNASAMELGDIVKDGDYVNAFVYTDLTSWSDTYCYFSEKSVSVESGKEITLTLLSAGFDASWNPITSPVAGANITLNGEKTDYKTDSDGKVTLTVFTPNAADSYVISAVSDTQILVPAVCKATVTGVPAPADNTTAAATTKSPVTGDSTNYTVLALVMILSLSGVFAFTLKGYYEK